MGEFEKAQLDELEAFERFVILDWRWKVSKDCALRYMNDVGRTRNRKG
jgi:hypothetical protein